MSGGVVKAAFEDQLIILPVNAIVPTKEVSKRHRAAEFYKQLTASLRHVGLIEPLVVYPREPGRYLLLDGHVRLEILRSIGVRKAKCLLSRDDETYTYNRHVSHIPTIAQHLMLLEALKAGLTEERIATALDVSLESIRVKRNLLRGICPEAVRIVADKRVSINAFRILRKMKPIRQIDVAKHMVAGGTYTYRYAKALLAITKPEMLERSGAPSKISRATSRAARSMLDEEDDVLLRKLKVVEDSFGTEVLALTVTVRYLIRLLSNAQIEQYLSRYHVNAFHLLQELLAEYIERTSTRTTTATVKEALHKSPIHSQLE